MTGLEQIQTHSLLQADVLRALKTRPFFISAISQNFITIATRMGCKVRISQRRLGEAYDLWQADVTRTLREGMPKDAVELDHFKQAAFIAFWLRRMIPINESVIDGPVFGQYTPDQLATRNRFLRYGNEICALVIGFQVCLNYHAAQIFPDDHSVNSIFGVRKNYLERVSFPEALLEDYAMVLKHKNMSPHGLYLLYRSLFTGAVPAGKPSKR